MKDLNKPRYEVIAEYPINETDIRPAFKVGIILERLNNATNNWYSTDGGNTGRLIDLHVIDKYPHLFSPLKWWEKREIGDMPEYFKYTRLDNNELVVVKVATWDYFGMQLRAHSLKDIFLIDGSDLPATIEDYQNYVNSQNK